MGLRRMDFRKINHVFALIGYFGYIVGGETCYNSGYSYYCSGYCSGLFGSETCNYYYYYYYSAATLSTGAYVGISIGGFIFFIIMIAVIIAICNACTKTAGYSGRMVHPSHTTVAVVAPPNPHQNTGMNPGVIYPPPTSGQPI